jgi:3-hydroxypropionyl-coenzyme A dehydratase
MKVRIQFLFQPHPEHVDINTGLQLEVYGWALCFTHEDRQKMMSSFLNKSKKKYESNYDISIITK